MGGAEVVTRSAGAPSDRPPRDRRCPTPSQFHMTGKPRIFRRIVGSEDRTRKQLGLCLADEPDTVVSASRRHLRTGTVDSDGTRPGPNAWKGMLNGVLTDDQRAKKKAGFSCQFGYQLAHGIVQKLSSVSPVHSVREKGARRTKFQAQKCRGVAQPGRASGSGPEGRWFESSRPDYFSWIQPHREGDIRPNQTRPEERSLQQVRGTASFSRRASRFISDVVRSLGRGDAPV